MEEFFRGSGLGDEATWAKLTEDWIIMYSYLLVLWAEQMRQQQRALKKTNRELERDRHGLERQERQLVRPDDHVCVCECHVTVTWSPQEAEIKKAAKRGDKQTAAVYAKQLVRLRQQKTKSVGLSAQITATGHQMTVSVDVGFGMHRNPLI